jgi:hypothetical protein
MAITIEYVEKKYISRDTAKEFHAFPASQNRKITWASEWELGTSQIGWSMSGRRAISTDFQAEFHALLSSQSYQNLYGRLCIQ